MTQQSPNPVTNQVSKALSQKKIQKPGSNVTMLSKQSPNPVTNQVSKALNNQPHTKIITINKSSLGEHTRSGEDNKSNSDDRK